jgi:hypothetical protein
MAELIPLHYRLKVAQKRHLHRWIVIAGLTTAVSLAGITHAFIWEHRQTSTESDLMKQVRAQSTVLLQSQRVLANRQGLADKMQKIEEMMDDKMLLSLLKNISAGFSGADCLEYINIDARGKSLPAPAPKPDKDGQPAAPPPQPETYVVRISGVTANSATLKDLVDRLSQCSSPVMAVNLESSHRENMFDGQVMRFEIVCRKPIEQKGT